MSCKYSSTAMLLLWSSCLSLCLICGPVASTKYLTSCNIFGDCRRYVYVEEPANIGARSSLNQPTASADNNVQRPQTELTEQPWNNIAPAPAPAAETAPTRVRPPAQGQRKTPAPAQGRAPVPYPTRLTTPAPAPPAAIPNQSAQQPTPQLVNIDNSEQGPARWPSANAGPVRPPAQYNYRERFSSLLLQPISRSNPRANMVYSPTSLHAMLGMLYVVSSGQTKQELQRAGQFGNMPQDVALDFKYLNEKQLQLVNAQLIVANKVYYNKELSTLNNRYELFAKEYYNSEIEGVNMRSKSTANNINRWASDATRGIIRELVSPSDIDEQTEAILVNAIYFKARWETEFSAQDTMPEKFRISNTKDITVPMMFNDDVFAYAELPELNAKALEMPYAGTEATMLLILPNQVEGLSQLESKLSSGSLDLNQVAAKLRRDTVTVRLPRFRIEYEQDMTGPLQQLGVQRMFTPESEIDAMLMRPVRISKILQKAFIDVNEAGSEAAAASYAKFVPLSLPVKSHEFTANHPFLFAIRTADTVLFIGHVVQPPKL